MLVVGDVVVSVAASVELVVVDFPVEISTDVNVIVDLSVVSAQFQSA